MTDEELKALVAENSRAIREMREEAAKQREEAAKQREEAAKRDQETERIWQEVRASRAETERIWRELRANREKSEQELHAYREKSEQELHAYREKSEQELRAYREKSEQELRANREESERIWQEVLASRKESDRVVAGLNRELGRLGNVLGLSVEYSFRPSLERILRERFGMTTVFHLSTHHEGRDFEVDLVGHTGDESDEVYLAEIKHQLREETIEQLLDHLRRFPRVFPEHRGKKLFGILAAVIVPPHLRTQALKEGFYLVTIKDDVFEITTPDDFEPRAFGLRSLGGQ